MELSVFGAFNAQNVAARDLRKGSEADSNGSGFTEALSECMQSDGSAAPESQGGVDGQVEQPKDASPTPRRFHNMRKKPCEDTGEDRGLDPNAPLQDGEPLEGGTSVQNRDQSPAVGLALSGVRRPVEPGTQGIDNDGKDTQGAAILSPMPLYGNSAVKDALSAPDQAPPEGATSVQNRDQSPAVGLALSGVRRPVEPGTQGIDNDGKDAQGAAILSPMPLYGQSDAVKDASSAPEQAPPEGATSVVQNLDQSPAVGLGLSGVRRSVNPEDQGIDNDGKDTQGAAILSPMPLYGNSAVKDASSVLDQAPPEGATSVQNRDQSPAVGLGLSGVRRPVEPGTQGIDNDGKDAQGAAILSPMPLYGQSDAVKDALSVPTVPSDPASASAPISSADETDGLTPPAGPAEKPASGPVESGHREAVSKDAVAAAFTMGAAKGADAGVHISNAVSVSTGNIVPAATGRGAGDNGDGQADGEDDGGAEPQALKGGFLRSEHHGMAPPGVSTDAQATGADPARFNADKGAEAAASAQAAQGGSSGSEGSGQSDGNGFGENGAPGNHHVKDAGPSGAEAFAIGKPAEKTSFDASKDTDTRTHNVAARNGIYDRIDSGLNIAVTRGAKEVSISLHPEHLGAIRIRLNMEDPSSNAVSARITVDSMEVKGVLDADAGALKEAFSRQGLKLDGYTIELGKNAFGADGGDSRHPNGAGAWGGGGTGGFRDGPSYRSAGGWTARNGETDERVHNVSTHRTARPGGSPSNAVDIFA